jgi:3-oxoacyl-[acyl-carrier protein] reductase
MINLSNQIMLITGASRGIGRATAIMAAQAGAAVIVNYRNAAAEAEKIVNEIKQRGGSALAIRADVSLQEEVNDMVKKVITTYGRIDALVNNAGIWTFGAINEMNAATWRETMAANLDSVYFCCRAVTPHMMAQRQGRIINLSSTAGQRGEAFHSHYAATKGAIISFTKSLAAELAPYNVLVNSVAPGWVDTDMSHQALVEEGDEISRVIPLRRAATPEEIAGPILFLASGLSTYITGEILNVNGGSVLAG